MEITNIVTSHITSQDPSDSSAPTWQPLPSAMAEDVETGVWPSVQSTAQLYSLLYRDVNMKIAFLIIGGKAQKAEVSLQRRLCISTSAFLKLVSVP